jgi:aminoglycoside/choline kinase family phosphotransferase
MTAVLDPSRRAAIEAQLAAWGWGGAGIAPLAADASFRRYWRIERSGAGAVLMDAPPTKEDVRPFVAIARHLSAHRFSAPAILACEESAGLVLLEDLGDRKFAPLLAAGHDPLELYGAAVDLLVALRRAPLPARLPPYDEDRLLAEARLLVEWYVPAVTGRAAAAATAAAFVDAWRRALAPVARARDTLVLRDYHADNLMWLAERAGSARVGLLDFQDAVAGHPAYDLVSLLEDARRDVAPALAERMVARYLGAGSDDPAAFRAAYAILGAQRNTKIVGIFTRLFRRDGKPAYLDLIPRVFGYLERDLAHPALAPVAAWYADALPPALRRRRPDGRGTYAGEAAK